MPTRQPRVPRAEQKLLVRCNGVEAGLGFGRRPGQLRKVFAHPAGEPFHHARIGFARLRHRLASDATVMGCDLEPQRRAGECVDALPGHRVGGRVVDDDRHAGRSRRTEIGDGFEGDVDRQGDTERRQEFARPCPGSDDGHVSRERSVQVC